MGKGGKSYQALLCFVSGYLLIIQKGDEASPERVPATVRAPKGEMVRVEWHTALERRFA